MAAHWKYKQGLANEQLGTEGDVRVGPHACWRTRRTPTPEDFIHSLKVDMFADEVFVFTPNGDVQQPARRRHPHRLRLLPSTPPWATAWWGPRSTAGWSPLTIVLQNGDIVEIITSKAAKGPSRDWMKIAKSSEARSKIRQWFKKERREENIANGRAAFEAGAEALRHPHEGCYWTRKTLPGLLKKVHLRLSG